MLYLHKPLRFNDCMIVLHSVVEYDNLSMSIIICLVCLNIVMGGIMMSLRECVFVMFAAFAFVGVSMVCGFMSFHRCEFGVLSMEVHWRLYLQYYHLCLMSVMFD